jgi:hypothetical protein
MYCSLVCSPPAYLSSRITSQAGILDIHPFSQRTRYIIKIRMPTNGIKTGNPPEKSIHALFLCVFIDKACYDMNTNQKTIIKIPLKGNKLIMS